MKSSQDIPRPLFRYRPRRLALAALCALATSYAATAQAAPWKGRIGGSLSLGPSFTMSDGGSPFFFVDTGVNYGIWRGLAIDFHFSFCFLRAQESGGLERLGGPLVLGFKPGLRYRFRESALTPYAALHLGMAYTKDDLHVGGKDLSESKVSFALDARLGAEWYFSEHWALDAFVALNHLASGYVPWNGEGSVAFLFVGLGISFSY